MDSEMQDISLLEGAKKTSAAPATVSAEKVHHHHHKHHHSAPAPAPASDPAAVVPSQVQMNNIKVQNVENVLRHVSSRGLVDDKPVVQALTEKIIAKTDDWAHAAMRAVDLNHRMALKKRGVAYNLKRAQAQIAKQKIDRMIMERNAKKVVKDFNFAIGEGDTRKLVRYEDLSLMVFNRENRVRCFFVRLVNNKWFERSVLTMILFNSIFFAMADYAQVDSGGNIIAGTSIRNAILLGTNTFFTMFFATEMSSKIIAMGFTGGHGSYLSDSWNKLDFLVVVSSILIMIDDTLPSISSLRLIRILRPLRSLTMLPGLRDIVKSIFASLPELGGVFSLMGFIFLVFAIAGMELFGGPSSHARCRLTPYPVVNSWVAPATGAAAYDWDLDVSSYRCLNKATFNLEEQNPDIKKSTSPWAEPQDCFWPIAPSENNYIRVCSLSGGGLNKCLHDIPEIPIEKWSWCGSNFDATGNRRFLNVNENSPNMRTYRNGKYPMNDKDLFIADLNFGYTNFDNFGAACLTIFQSITQEGWTTILYMQMDANGEKLAGMYFSFLILLGCFFVLQLLLAVLEDNFQSAKEAVKLANEEDKRIADEADRLDKEARLKEDASRKIKAAETVVKTFSKRRGSLLHGNSVSADERTDIASLNITALFRRNSINRKAQAVAASSGSDSDMSTPPLSPSGSPNTTLRKRGNVLAITAPPGVATPPLSPSGTPNTTLRKRGNVLGITAPPGVDKASLVRHMIEFPSKLQNEVTQLGSPRKGEDIREATAASSTPKLTPKETFASIASIKKEPGVAKLSLASKFKSSFLTIKHIAGFAKVPAQEDKDDESIGKGGNFGSSLAGFVANRELENKTMTRLDHFTLEEFIGTDAADYVEEKFADCFESISQFYAKFKSAISCCKKKDVDLTAPIPPPGFINSISLICKKITCWSHFETISGIFILLNCITLMADHYPMTTTVASGLDNSNAGLTLIFFFEMVINVSAYGPRFYIKDTLSFFDAFVVFASLIDLGLAPPKAFGNTGIDLGGVSSLSSVISILRCFRLFRIIKLAIKVKSLKVLFSRVAKTIMDLATYMILLFVLILIYTVAGLQFFANMFRYDEYGEQITLVHSEEWINAPDQPRYTFDDFSSSFASVFQIITTENWNDIMYNSWRSFGPAAALYSVSLVMIGTFILMNLFLGILLSNFTKVDEEEATEDDNDLADRAAAAQLEKRFNPNPNPNPKRNTSKVAPLPVLATLVDKVSNASRVRHHHMVEALLAKHEEPEEPEPIKEEEKPPRLSFSLFGSPTKVAPVPTDEEHGSVHVDPKGIVTQADLKTIGDDQNEHASSKQDSIFPLNSAYTLGIFGPANPVRVFCGHLIEHTYFEGLIQLLILLSSLSLAIDSPLDDPKSSFRDAMFYFEFVTTFLFSMETLLKIVVTGLAFNKGAYLRSGWNQLDFIIVVISVISLFDDGGSLKALKSIRSLRALRPLRVISRAPGLRTIVNAVFDSIPDVINVLAVVLVCFSIFAVIGVNFLKGDLRSCSGDHFDSFIATNATAMNVLQFPEPWAALGATQKAFFAKDSIVADRETFSSCTYTYLSGANCCPDIFLDNKIPTGKQICKCWGGSWTPVAYNTLDNYPLALMAFFSISTTENWVDLMYAAVDARGIDMQPVRGSNYGYIYFFIFFIILGNFFALNLFVGVMIDNFEKTKFALQGDLVFMTPEQQEWTRAQQQARSIKPLLHPVPPDGEIGNFCFKLSQRHEFEWFIIFAIFMNTLVLAGDYFGIIDSVTELFSLLNIVFAALFTLEMMIKLLGLRRVYFQSVWNIFDFFVTIGSDLGILYFYVTGDAGAMAIMLIRIFRVLRVIRLMEGLETAKRLVDTLLLTLPGIINISVLLMLIIFIYAVLGMQLFAKTGYNMNYSVHANFRTFKTSLLTLVRFATGEGWGNFMYDASFQSQGCQFDPDFDDNMCGFNDKNGCVELNGCGNTTIYPFLLSYTLFVTMVLFNLFVGVIIEGFSGANDVTKALKNEDYNNFCAHWAPFDPNATCFMSIENFEEFVATLFSPLGLKEKHPTHAEAIAFLSTLDLNVYQINSKTNYVHFKECLVALISSAFKELKGERVVINEAKLRLEEDATYAMTKDSGFSKIEKCTASGEVNHDAVFTLKEHYAVIKCEHTYLGYKHRKKLTCIVSKAIERAKIAKENMKLAQESKSILAAVTATRARAREEGAELLKKTQANLERAERERQEAVAKAAANTRAHAESLAQAEALKEALAQAEADKGHFFMKEKAHEEMTEVLNLTKAELEKSERERLKAEEAAANQSQALSDAVAQAQLNEKRTLEEAREALKAELADELKTAEEKYKFSEQERQKAVAEAEAKAQAHAAAEAQAKKHAADLTKMQAETNALIEALRQAQKEAHERDIAHTLAVEEASKSKEIRSISSTENIRTTEKAPLGRNVVLNTPIASTPIFDEESLGAHDDEVIEKRLQKRLSIHVKNPEETRHAALAPIALAEIMDAKSDEYIIQKRLTKRLSVLVSDVAKAKMAFHTPKISQLKDLQLQDNEEEIEEVIIQKRLTKRLSILETSVDAARRFKLSINNNQSESKERSAESPFRAASPDNEIDRSEG